MNYNTIIKINNKKCRQGKKLESQHSIMRCIKRALQKKNAQKKIITGLGEKYSRFIRECNEFNCLFVQRIANT